MRAIFNRWVLRLIGKPSVPYNRRLRVRRSPRPHDYDAGLSLPAAESNAFRIHSDLPWPARLTALSTCLASSGANRAHYVKDAGENWSLAFGAHSAAGSIVAAISFVTTENIFPMCLPNQDILLGGVGIRCFQNGKLKIAGVFRAPFFQEALQELIESMPRL